MTFALATVAARPDKAGGPPPQVLRATGQPPAITYETSRGHLVQLDPETREFVGVAIVDYKAQWEGQEIAIEIPVVEERVLQLV